MRLDELTVGYGRRVLVDKASAQLGASKLTALIGRNGAGKSSLLRVLAGLDAPLGGCVRLDGVDVGALTAAERAKKIALVTTQRVKIPRLSCRDLVTMGRAPYTDWAGRLGRKDLAIVDDALASVGMEAYAGRTMDKMSDGECQRVMIARALAQDTPVLLLDEPTSFLDMPNRYELCLLLKRLARQKGKTVVFSTHELDIALDIADEIMLIDSPRLVYGPVEEVIESGAIERLFSSPNVRFDTATRKVRFAESN